MSFLPTSLLNQTMDVLDVTETRDSQGGFSESTTVKHDDVPCRIRALRGVETRVIGREGKEVNHRIYANKDFGAGAVGVVVKDRIKIGTREFDVEFVDDPHELAEFLQIDVADRS